MTSREGVRHLPGDNQERKPRPAFTERLKGQFRQLAKAIIDRPPGPEPKPSRRKRTEETRGGFIMAARSVAANTRRVFRQFRELADRVGKPPAPPVFDIFIPPDPAEARQLLLWRMEQWNNADDVHIDFECPAQDALSLNL